MIFEHRCPIYPGEDILTSPSFDDPRVTPWVKTLIEHGIIDKNFQILKGGTMMRGIGPAGYLFRIEIDETECPNCGRAPDKCQGNCIFNE